MCCFQRKVQGVNIPSMSLYFGLSNVKNKCNVKGRLSLIFTLFTMVLKTSLDERVSLHYFTMHHIYAFKSRMELLLWCCNT